MNQNMPMIFRCTREETPPWLHPDDTARLWDGMGKRPDGCGALILPDGEILFGEGRFRTNNSFEEGDFLEICQSEEGLCAERPMTCDRPDRTLFVTERCNSNCEMCPYGSRRRMNGRDEDMRVLLRYIDLMNPQAEYLCITGGEPTLLKRDFLALLRRVRERMPDVLLHILTNGRTFWYRDFFEEYRAVRPYQTLLGIPLHGSSEALHDAISGAHGSFAQTLRGLDRCYHAGEHIELRVVTSALNCKDLPALAEFIGKRYPAALHVSLMGLEMMGNAMAHRDRVWIPFHRLWPYLREAVDVLLGYGVSVRLFNYPLCMIGEPYQSLYSRSISDYKIRYKPECDGCTRKDACGGLFETTLAMKDILVRPYR